MRFLILLAILASCAQVVDDESGSVRDPSVILAQTLLDSTVRVENDAVAGSGFAIGIGIVATAGHIVRAVERGTTPLQVRTRTGHLCDVESTHVVSDEDLAFVWVRGCDHIRPVLMSDDVVLEGLSVLAAGHPLMSDWTVADGIVSNRDVVMRSTLYPKPHHVLMLSAPINRGMSGGPVVTQRGELVGVVVGLASRDGMWAGVSFAVPVDDVRDRLSDVRGARSKGR